MLFLSLCYIVEGCNVRSFYQPNIEVYYGKKNLEGPIFGFCTFLINKMYADLINTNDFKRFFFAVLTLAFLNNYQVKYFVQTLPPPVNIFKNWCHF